MKTHSPHDSVDCQQLNGHQAFRSLAIAAAVGLCVMVNTGADAQSRLFGEATKSSNMVRNGLFTQGNETYRVVDTAAFRTMADIGTTEAGSIAQVDYAGNCSSCGTTCQGDCAGGNSACGSCGTDCGGACSSYGDLRTNYVDPCASCDSFWYITVEGLYMIPDGRSGFSLSPDFRMNDYDFAGAPRLTIGAVPDCVHGCELSYVGRLEWDRAGARSDPGGGINSLVTPGSPLSVLDLSSFNGATSQIQTYRAEYWSVEANKTLMGWGVAKVLAGARYINYEERYNYLSQTATETGLLVSAVENQLFGAQVGMDLLYPICNYAYTDFRTRFGAYANSADSGLQVINDGSTVLAGSDDSTDLAGVFEVGGGIRFQPGRMLSIRAGGELWYLKGIATSNRQLRDGVVGSGTISPQTNDDIVIAGFSIGAELKY
jgi:hypothetical protein